MTAAIPSSSGTIGQTSIPVQTLFDIAARRAGKSAESLTPEQVNSLRYGLFYILSNLSNRGINLWATKTFRLGVNPGKFQYDLPAGTVDLLNANYSQLVNRWVQYVPDTSTLLPWCDSDASTYAEYSVVTARADGAPETLGILLGPTATGVLANRFVLEYNDPTAATETWVQVATTETFNQNGSQDNTWLYMDFNGLPSEVQGVTITYWRVRGVSAVNTTGNANIRELVTGTNLQEIPMAPLNRDDYFNLPNKTFQSARPLQYFFQKNITPQIWLWPVPNDPSYSINLFLHTHIQDVGQLIGELYVPQRWLPYIQSAVAHNAALELPGTQLERVQYLEAQMKEMMQTAEDSEEDGLPIFLAPNISYYTA